MICPVCGKTFEGNKCPHCLKFTRLEMYIPPEKEETNEEESEDKDKACICPECGELIFTGSGVCPACGYEFDTESD